MLIDTDIPNLAMVETGIYRGGQPNDAGWNWLKFIDITSVVKLNTAGEAQDVAAEALGMTVGYFPIDFDEQLFFRPTKPLVQTATQAIAAPCFIHCEHGQDRTGLIIGCWRVWQCKWSKGQAWKEMREHGFHEALLGLTLFWETEV